MNEHSEINVLSIIWNLFMIVSALVITGLHWGYKPVFMCIFCIACALNAIKDYLEL